MSVIAFKDKDGNVNMHLAGRVTKEPKSKENSRGGKCIFSMSYGKKKYMQIEVWSDNEYVYDTACRLDKGDVISVDGAYSTWTFNDKQYESVTADYIDAPKVPLVPVRGGSAAPASTANPVTSQDFEELDGEDALPFE